MNPTPDQLILRESGRVMVQSLMGLSSGNSNTQPILNNESPALDYEQPFSNSQAERYVQEDKFTSQLLPLREDFTLKQLTELALVMIKAVNNLEITSRVGKQKVTARLTGKELHELMKLFFHDLIGKTAAKRLVNLGNHKGTATTSGNTVGQRATSASQANSWPEIQYFQGFFNRRRGEFIQTSIYDEVLHTWEDFNLYRKYHVLKTRIKADTEGARQVLGMPKPRSGVSTATDVLDFLVNQTEGDTASKARRKIENVASSAQLLQILVTNLGPGMIVLWSKAMNRLLPRLGTVKSQTVLPILSKLFAPHTKAFFDLAADNILDPILDEIPIPTLKSSNGLLRESLTMMEYPMLSDDAE